MAEQFYTISSAKRLDGQDNYGNVTDSVYFEGEKDSALYKHAPTTTVEKGVKVYGIIEELPTKAGGTYRKFSKKQVPEDVENESTPQNGSQTRSKVPTSRPDNSDGQRQGMSINNAAKYVIESAVKDSISLEPSELADEIRRYAKAIYNIDLTKNTDQDILDMMSE